MDNNQETRSQVAIICPQCGNLAEIRADFVQDKKMYKVHVICPKCHRKGPVCYTRTSPESGYASEDYIKAVRAWSMGLPLRDGESLEVL